MLLVQAHPKMMTLVADMLLLATDAVDSDVYLSVQHISFNC